MPVGQEGRGRIGRKRPQVQYYKIRLKCTPRQPDFFPAPVRPFPAPPVERCYAAGGCSYIIYRCTAIEPAGGCSFCCSSARRRPASRRGRPGTALRPVATGLRPVVPGLSPVTTRPIPGFCATGALRGTLGNMLTRQLSVSGRKRIFAGPSMPARPRSRALPSGRLCRRGFLCPPGQSAQGAPPSPLQAAAGTAGHRGRGGAASM